MLFQKLYVNNAAEPADIRVTDGKFEEIGPDLAPRPGRRWYPTVPASWPCPPLWSPRPSGYLPHRRPPRWNLSGTLFEGIQCWEEYKPSLTKGEVKERVNRAIRLQASNGIQYVRTHVDINDPKLTALRPSWSCGRRSGTLWTSRSWPSPSTASSAIPTEGAAGAGPGDGGRRRRRIPHFEFTREYSVDSLNICFQLARSTASLSTSTATRSTMRPLGGWKQWPPGL